MYLSVTTVIAIYHVYTAVPACVYVVCCHQWLSPVFDSAQDNQRDVTSTTFCTWWRKVVADNIVLRTLSSRCWCLTRWHLQSLDIESNGNHWSIHYLWWFSRTSISFRLGHATQYLVTYLLHLQRAEFPYCRWIVWKAVVCAWAC